MHKEVQTARASRFKYVITAAFLFLGSVYFVFLNARSTSASLKVIGFGTNQCGDFVLLQLSNAGPKSITYTGYETNDPCVDIQFQTLAGRSDMARYPFSSYTHDVELKPRRGVEFRVLTSDIQKDFRVALTYWVPTTLGPLDWLRYHVPYQVSAWLPGGFHSRTALTPLITTNSQVAMVN
ncbi:MAG TPA: hypothetical protein VKV04_06985 [Verrucomicrobiae bacterium]|nr:hypothetical protein [Verrucomicrobiae bacterium]